MGIPDMDARGFYEYVKARICPNKRTYLFFDEVQKVHGWENAVNSFRVDFDCDIYITGSNAYLLSSELSTYLSGRYVEIKVLPLSFREFLDFHGYILTERKSPALDGVYSAAVINDILEREKRRGQKQITDPTLLRKIILFIPLIFILPHLLPDPVFGVFLAEPVSDILAATITTITFFARFDKILDRGAAHV